jgi:prolyl-tRNA synthetase
MVMLHGDDKGLVLPPKIAPVQVVIVPIPYKEANAESILAKARELHLKLQKHDVSAVVDDRAEYTPGWKFNDWEVRGVPIRIEIGPRDLKQKQITIVRRDTSERTSIKESGAINAVAKLLEEIQTNLFNKAKKFLEENITTVETYGEFKNVLRDKGGFIRVSWCGNSVCEEKIKEETGATIRTVPFEKEKLFSRCLYCHEKAKEIVYFARAY